MTQPAALTLAGADPSGGAGIQADLKTFAAHGVYGLSVVTVLTAQNAVRFSALPVAPDFIMAQAEALFADHDIRAIKIGMLAGRDGVAAVIGVLRRFNDGHRLPVVLDPVLATSTDAVVHDAAGRELMREQLLPLATLVKPNISEAALLLGCPPAASIVDMAAQALRLRDLGCAGVYLSGGHLVAEAGQAVDIFCDERGASQLAGPRRPNQDVHGSGCTLTAAICANLALGYPLGVSVERAKAYVQRLFEGEKQLDRSGRAISFRHGG